MSPYDDPAASAGEIADYLYSLKFQFCMHQLALTLLPGQADFLARAIRQDYPAQGLSGSADIVVGGITRHEDASSPVATIVLRSPFQIDHEMLFRLAWNAADLARR